MDEGHGHEQDRQLKASVTMCSSDANALSVLAHPFPSPAALRLR
jgi:hypothetical protein